MEMDVVLRTLLRELTFAPTDAPDERRALHGVVVAPGRGARITDRRASVQAANDRDSIEVATPRQASDA